MPGWSGHRNHTTCSPFPTVISTIACSSSPTSPPRSAEIAGLRTITFNGVVEWSLDWILSEDVVWMPSEAQLRERVGANLVALERTPDGYRCTVECRQSGTRQFDSAEAADAYAAALLALVDRIDRA